VLLLFYINNISQSKRIIKMKGERLFRKIARNFDGGGVVYHSHSMVFGVCRQTDRSYDTIR